MIFLIRQSSDGTDGEKIIRIKKLGGLRSHGGTGGAREFAMPPLAGGGPMAFDLADEFRGEAQVGGDHILRNALDEIGEGPVEMVVALLAGEGIDKKKILLGGGESALNDETEVAIQLGDLVAESGGDRLIENGDLGRFDGLDIKVRGLLPVEALIVGDPPILYGKLNDLFDAVLLNKIHAAAAF